jgi:hypothetical protein
LTVVIAIVLLRLPEHSWNKNQSHVLCPGQPFQVLRDSRDDSTLSGKKRLTGVSDIAGSSAQ